MKFYDAVFLFRTPTIQLSFFVQNQQKEKNTSIIYHTFMEILFALHLCYNIPLESFVNIENV